MKERKLDFKVYLPQLECEPGKFKGGLKRSYVHKNEDSPALVLGGNTLFSNLNVSASNSSAISSPPPHQRMSSLQRSPIPLTLKDLKALRSPAIIQRDPALSNLLDLMSHPAFQQKRFTRHTPKPLPSNPILGYPSTNSISPQNKRSNLIEYGNQVLAQHRQFI